MTSQQSLDFDVCASRHRGNELSQLAHARVAPHASALRGSIYDWLLSHGPATCEEIANALGLRYTTVSARASELKARGRIIATDQRRATETGCSAAVLKAVTKGETTGGL